MTKQLVHRKKRREHNKCAVEGCDVITGDTYRCQAHAKSHAEYCRRSREKEKRP